MPDKLKHLQTFLLSLSVVFINVISAQNQTNNYGKEFRFTFIQNYGIIEKVAFSISLEKPSTLVTIKCGSLTWFDTIYRLDTIINFKKSDIPSASNFNPGRSILITSNKPIAVSAMNNASNSTDISAITPTERIPGNPEYYINTYRGDVLNGSLFSIVALDDSCLINIMPTADSKYNLVKNTPFTILLRKGQVYEEEALDSQSFAGTRIWNSLGCRKFSVFEGAKCSYVDYATPSCAGCDHLYNQSRPLQFLGKKFTTLPYSDMSMGYVFQIVATENNTAISIDGTPVVTLNRGEVYTMNKTNNMSVRIQADQPVSVVELMKSGKCNGHSKTLGNPSLMTILPDEQLTTRIGFSFPNTSNISQNPSFPAEYYIGIVCPTVHLKTIKINGVDIDTINFSRSSDQSVGSIRLNPGLSYQVTSGLGFLAYMYAYGADESYASEIGSGFENKSTELFVEPKTTFVCDTFQNFRFMAKSDSLASFKWNFGDGTFGSGDSVNKVYNKTGQFTMKLSVQYTANKGCTADTLSKLISVNNRPYFSFGRDTNLCIGIFYQMAPLSKPRTTYKWFDNSSSSAITVSNNRTVWLTITDSNQCSFTDTIKVQFINCDTNSIKIPNVFTPGMIVNGTVQTDEFNDLFETEFTGFDLLNGKIFNRWGMVVYSFDYPRESYWNGSVNNDNSKPCPSGTYYYIFEFVNSNTNFTKSYNGVVQLIR